MKITDSCYSTELIILFTKKIHKIFSPIIIFLFSCDKIRTNLMFGNIIIYVNICVSFANKINLNDNALI